MKLVNDEEMKALSKSRLDQIRRSNISILSIEYKLFIV